MVLHKGTDWGHSCSALRWKSSRKSGEGCSKSRRQPGLPVALRPAPDLQRAAFLGLDGVVDGPQAQLGVGADHPAAVLGGPPPQLDVLVLQVGAGPPPQLDATCRDLGVRSPRGLSRFCILLVGRRSGGRPSYKEFFNVASRWSLRREGSLSTKTAFIRRRRAFLYHSAFDRGGKPRFRHNSTAFSRPMMGMTRLRKEFIARHDVFGHVWALSPLRPRHISASSRKLFICTVTGGIFSPPEWNFRPGCSPPLQSFLFPPPRLRNNMEQFVDDKDNSDKMEVDQAPSESTGCTTSTDDRKSVLTMANVAQLPTAPKAAGAKAPAAKAKSNSSSSSSSKLSGLFGIRRKVKRRQKAGRRL